MKGSVETLRSSKRRSPERSVATARHLRGPPASVTVVPPPPLVPPQTWRIKKK